MGEQKQPKAGWLARWRVRRREKVVRANAMRHRAREAQDRDALRADKYGHLPGGP
jgi:hypothetical protein